MGIMKARIKETDEIFQVLGVIVNTSEGYALDEVDLYCDETDNINIKVSEDYWTRLEHQYAGMAMNALLLTNNVRNGDLEGMRECNTNAIAIAHALVEKLKNE